MQNLPFFAEFTYGSCCTQYATKTFFHTCSILGVKVWSLFMSHKTKATKRRISREATCALLAGKMEFLGCSSHFKHVVVSLSLSTICIQVMELHPSGIRITKWHLGRRLVDNTCCCDAFMRLNSQTFRGRNMAR